MWVVSFRPKSAGSTSGGYAGLDFQQPPDVRGFVNALQALIFWGGLHHNIKEVPPDQQHVCYCPLGTA